MAAAVYFFQLGRAAFDDAEAYSAYIASRPDLRALFEASRQLDPGKGGGLYVFILHWYVGIFGTGEGALRAVSAACAVASIILVYAFTADLLGDDVALIACALWAFNPMALIVARWARMYSMFIALTLGSLLMLRKVERHPNPLRVAMLGMLGGAMLYTHLGGAVMLAAEVAILARDRWRGQRIGAGCAGIAIALTLFAPISSSSLSQVRASALGHRFDWIGSPLQLPLMVKIVGVAILVLIATILVFGRAWSRDPDGEPIRWCAIWSLFPLLALAGGSVLLHPMFEIRYVAPVVAGGMILLAAVLDFASPRTGNLAVTALLAMFLVPAMLFQIYHRPFALWREVARAVEAAHVPSQTVFFEAGYVMGIEQAAGLDPDSLIEVLPDGYLRIPFDYYFRGSNPRRAVNPFRPALARAAIEQAARRDGGAWLLSHMNDGDLARELPPSNDFVARRVIYDESVSVSLYHIVQRQH